MSRDVWGHRAGDEGRPLLIAHRGASEIATENSMEALRLAVANGVDGVEIDIRVTRDGRLVCFHDDSLARLTGKDIRIAETDFAELAAAYPALVTLEEALALAEVPAFMLDIKEKTLEATLAILAVVNASPRPHSAIFTVRDLGIARHLAQHHPDVRQMCMFRDDDGVTGFIAMADKRSWVRISEPHLSERTVERVRNAGLSLSVVVGGIDLETAGKIDASRLRAVLGFKPGAVILDDVVMAAAVLKEAVHG